VPALPLRSCVWEVLCWIPRINSLADIFTWLGAKYGYMQLL